MKVKVFEILVSIISIICVAFLAWFVASWIDVVAHNLDPIPQYHSWNLLIKIFG